MKSVKLQKEFKFYNSINNKLLKHYEGKFVLIKDSEIIGYFDTSQEAYASGIEKFGQTPFFIKQILKNEPADEIPALMAGVISAYL